MLKGKKGVVSREVLTQQWADGIDYCPVDFESKRETVQVSREPAHQVGLPSMKQLRQLHIPEYGEVWTGDYVFENEWQSFRTKKDRSLELKTPPHECTKGRCNIAVKVVDILANDTMKIIGVTV